MYSFKIAFVNSVKLSKPFHDLELLWSQNHLISVPFFRGANCSSQKVSCPRTLRSLASELKFLPHGLSNLRLFFSEADHTWPLLPEPHVPQRKPSYCGRHTVATSNSGTQCHSFPGMEVSEIAIFFWCSHIFMRQYLLPLWLNPLATQTQLPFQQQHASKATHLAAKCFWAKPERSNPPRK